MTRAAAIARAHAHFDSGEFLVDLRRRVAIPSTSQEPERAGALRGYLEDEMVASLAPLGFTTHMLENPMGPPFLAAERIEDPALVTVLIYGHGDTIRGLDEQWRSGLSPWALSVEGTRWYGRGTADNKGQHTINIAALAPLVLLAADHVAVAVGQHGRLGGIFYPPCDQERAVLCARIGQHGAVVAELFQRLGHLARDVLLQGRHGILLLAGGRNGHAPLQLR